MSTNVTSAGHAPEGVVSESWHLEHDNLDDAHCVSVLGSDLEYLSARARAELGADLQGGLHGFTSYMLQRRLEAAVSRVEARVAAFAGDDPDGQINAVEAILDELSAARAQAEAHGDCQCGSDAWNDMGRSFFDSVLSATATTSRWAVFNGDGTPACTYAGDLTVSDLWTAVGGRNGWESVELTWDATTGVLSFGFDAVRGNCTAVPMTHAHDLLIDELEHLVDVEDPACVVVSADPTALALTMALWGDVDSERLTSLVHIHDEDFSAALAAVTARIVGLPVEAHAALLALAPTWASSLDQLLNTAAAITVNTPAYTA